MIISKDMDKLMKESKWMQKWDVETGTGILSKQLRRHAIKYKQRC